MSVYLEAAKWLAERSADRCTGVCAALLAVGAVRETLTFTDHFAPTPDERERLGAGRAFWLADFRPGFTHEAAKHTRLIALGFAHAMAKTGDIPGNSTK